MSNPAWYLALGGQALGPLTVEDVAARLNAGEINGETLVYGPGVPQWAPLRTVPALMGLQGGSPPPPPPPAPGQCDEIDYRVFGEEMQYVEVELDPGESAVAEAGAMLYMTQNVEMNTIFGDGRAGQENQGILDSLLGAGKRLLTGESLFITIFTNRGAGKERVAFAAPYPGKLVPVNLAQLGGELICQKEAFLCAARGVALEIAFQKRFGVGLFGGEGFIMQRLQGSGWVFMHAGGNVFQMDLAAGETLKVDTGCLVALMPGVDYDIEFTGGIKNALFGGEGLFLARLTGPGHVWLQSLPLSRMAGRIYAAAPQGGGKQTDEGSVIRGALGTFFGGK